MVIIERLRLLGSIAGLVMCYTNTYVKSCVIVKNTFKKLQWATICEFRLTF